MLIGRFICRQGLNMAAPTFQQPHSDVWLSQEYSVCGSCSAGVLLRLNKQVLTSLLAQTCNNLPQLHGTNLSQSQGHRVSCRLLVLGDCKSQETFNHTLL